MSVVIIHSMPTDRNVRHIAKLKLASAIAINWYVFPGRNFQTHFYPVSKEIVPTAIKCNDKHHLEASVEFLIYTQKELVRFSIPSFYQRLASTNLFGNLIRSTARHIRPPRYS